MPFRELSARLPRTKKTHRDYTAILPRYTAIIPRLYRDLYRDYTAIYRGYTEIYRDYTAKKICSKPNL
jgi:hypothetical protein